MRKSWPAVCICIMLAAECFAAAFVSGDDAVPLTDSVQEGDLVTFGKYEQDAEESDESFRALEWLVLEKDDDEALLITDKVIAAVPFESASETTETEDLEKTWEECSLREWLNNIFTNTAFSEEERDLLQTVTVETPDSGDIDGGEDTEDEVFLLSADEALDYFKKKSARQAKATDRAANAEEGLTVFVSDLTEDTAFWWLRSPGSKAECRQVVGPEGAVAEGGYLASRLDIGVRPAVWVRLPEEEVAESGGNKDYEAMAAQADAGPGPQDYPGAQGEMPGSGAETP